MNYLISKIANFELYGRISDQVGLLIQQHKINLLLQKFLLVKEVPFFLTYITKKSNPIKELINTRNEGNECFRQGLVKNIFVDIAYNASLAQKYQNFTQKIVQQLITKDYFYCLKKFHAIIFKILKDQQKHHS